MNDQDDRQRFRDLVGPCRELFDDHVEPWRPRPRPRRRSAPSPDGTAGTARPGADTPRSGPAGRAPRGLRRRLARGRYPLVARLDLHGLTTTQAEERLATFIARQRGLEHRCVLIIHGKGLRSRDGRPVLKALVHRWLERDRAVTAFCAARAADGGDGAVYALLKPLR